ncbi:MAG: LemA family protein [Patulibacter minatonensis]
MVALIVVVALVVLVGLYVLLTYNRLVALRNNVENSWSQVDVALKMRHDLVPNLAEAVKGYAAHERGTFDAVTQARTAAVAAPTEPGAALGAAESTLGSMIGQLLVIAEDYPDLKASTSFLALQQQLSSIESQIQIARRVYNDTVETYLTKLQRIPSNFVASAFSFAPREFFRAPVEAQTAPSVDVGGSAAR